MKKKKELLRRNFYDYLNDNNDRQDLLDQIWLFLLEFNEEKLKELADDIDAPEIYDDI